MQEILNEREKTILKNIIHSFIHTATPVGSRFISKNKEIGLSPATVRNVMSDLEELGYINHPHTSAGRIPTDKGYRFYVDALMEVEQLSQQEQSVIQKQLTIEAEREELLRVASKILGTISHQLGIVLAPKITTGIFEKLELVQISSTHIMVILSIRSGVVKTIMMEVHAEIPRTKLEDVSRMLNERLAGLPLKKIRETFSARVKDVHNEETGLIRLFIESVDKLFDETRTREKVHIGGTSEIITQPEFETMENFRGVIELLDNEEIIVHVLEKSELKNSTQPITVTIGKENNDEKFQQYSIVTSTYNVGDISGTIGILGTKRMNYSKMIPLVDYVAKTISIMLKENKNI